MFIPFHTIHIDRRAEAAFRRRALKAYPKEYLEILWGFIDDGIANICVYMPLDQKATKGSIDYDQRHIGHQKIEARKYQMEVLGSIHTHPGLTDAIFSDTDLREVQKHGEKITAICAIEEKTLGSGKTRRICRLAYWPGVRPMKVEYKERKAK
jgi:proteasome lid subunit RPN8/RPN11